MEKLCSEQEYCLFIFANMSSLFKKKNTACFKTLSFSREILCFNKVAFTKLSLHLMSRSSVHFIKGHCFSNLPSNLKGNVGQILNQHLLLTLPDTPLSSAFSAFPCFTPLYSALLRSILLYFASLRSASIRWSTYAVFSYRVFNRHAELFRNFESSERKMRWGTFLLTTLRRLIINSLKTAYFYKTPVCEQVP